MGGGADGLWEGLARAARGRPWQASVWRERRLRVEGREGRASTTERWWSAYVAFRIDLGGGRVGFASAALARGTDPGDIVARAVASARAQDPLPGADLEGEVGPGVAPADALRIRDPRAAGLGPGDLEAFVRALEDAARSLDGRVRAVRKPSAEAVETFREIRNHRGQSVAWTETRFGASLEVAAAQGEASETGWAAMERRSWSDLDAGRLAREAVERAVELLGAEGCRHGRFPVVLDARVAAEVLGVLAPSFLGESHLKGTSLFRGRMGRPVASDRITIWDDGVLPGGTETQPVDDEGVPRTRTRVVGRGVLEVLLYDRATAARAGARSTGNAAGGPEGPPGPDVTNLYIEAGPDGTARDLCWKAWQGLWVREVLGLHTVDPISGDFSVGCSGLWIRGGQAAHPVTGAALAGNLLDLLGAVAAVGSDLRFHDGVGAPSLLVEAADLS